MIRVYRWREAIKDLTPAWAELVCLHGLNPSLHPDWMDITISTHDLESQSYVVLVETPCGEQAVIPLLVRRVSISGVPIRCLDLCSNILSYHAELAASGAHAKVLEELLASKLLPPWDVLRIGNVVSDGLTALAADSIGTAASNVLTYPGERSPYIAMSQEWPEYLQSLPKKMRANITRCIRTTQLVGEASMTWFEQDGDTERLMSDILEVESRSWKARDNKAFRADMTEGRYHQRLLPWLTTHGLIANVLYVNTKPAAYVLCARWQGWVGQLKTSFADDVRDAGFRVIQASIERAHHNREREYDFLGDAAPHKLRWTDRIRAHEDKWIFARHWRGRSFLRLKRAIDLWKRMQRTAQDGPPDPRSDLE